MANSFKSSSSFRQAAKLSLFVMGVSASACGLDPAPAQNPAASSTGGPTSVASTSSTNAQDTSSDQSSSSSDSASASSNSGPKADCIGVNPEGEPEDDGFFAYQEDTTSTTGESSSEASSSSDSTGSAETSTADSSSSSTDTSSTDTESTDTSSSSESGTDSSTGTSSTGTSSTGEGGCLHPACVGDESVSWQLHDHQPRSCGFGQDYGQDAYYGKTTMVVFLAGWCNFCLRQTVGLEKLRIEWAREGKDISILIVNAASANNIEFRSEIVNRTSNPVFQDTTFADVWGAMAGAKDSFYIYDGKGILREYLPSDGKVNIDLSDAAAYADIKRRAESVLAAQF